MALNLTARVVVGVGPATTVGGDDALIEMERGRRREQGREDEDMPLFLDVQFLGHRSSQCCPRDLREASSRNATVLRLHKSHANASSVHR